MKDLSYFISKKGCYVGPFIVNFTCNYFLCHSFFLSLFRYICILHPEKTFRLGLNAPKVSTTGCLNNNSIAMSKYVPKKSKHQWSFFDKLESFQKLASICLVCEVIFATSVSYCQMYLGAYRQRLVYYCLGQNEMFFDFDYFIMGGYHRSAGNFGLNFCQVENPLGRWVCNFGLVVGVIVESNLVEIYFIGKVAFGIKKYTKNAASLLSRKGLEARKR